MFEKEAEEYRKENLCKKCHNHCKEGMCTCAECKTKTYKDGAEFGYNKGFKDCAKSRLNVTTISDCPIKEEWHDLRKDYIVCYLDTACERHTFELSFVDWFEDKHWIDEDNHNIYGYDEGVIAWCEIPTFDKE